MSPRSVQARLAARFAAVATLILLSPITAAAAAPHRLGLIVQLGVNISHEETIKLTQALDRALTEAIQIDVVSGYDVTRRMPPGGVREDCLGHKDCIKDVGNRLNADQLLFLVVVRVGARVQIDSTWVDVATGKTTPRDAILLEEKGASRKEVLAKAAKKLIPNAEPRKVPEKIEPDPSLALKKPPRSTTATITEPPGFFDDPRINRPTVIVPVAVSAVALLAGGLFGLSARTLYDDLVSKGCLSPLSTCDKNSQNKDNVSSLQTRDAIADILFLTSILSAGTAAYFYLFVPPGDAKPAPKASISIGFSGTGGAVGISGTF